MKKKVFLSIVLIGLIVLGINQNSQADADGAACGTAIVGYKKQLLRSGCKEAPGYICYVRCKGADLPSISI